jgi:cyclohexanecarboxyl-CoA dehydrogenase
MPLQCSAVEFSWSRQQLAFRGLAIQSPRTKINSGALDRDRIAQFPDKVWKECASFDIFGVTMPEQYNGSGRDMVIIGLAMESLGFDCEPL